MKTDAKILIVDDEWESPIVKAVRRRLDEEGWHTLAIEADSKWAGGEDFEAAALYTIEEEHPDGVLLDVRLGDYKLLEYFENGTVQLFNLKADIGEQNDLSQTEAAKAAELREKLLSWRKRIGAQMIQPNPDYDASTYPWATP